ncbi:MAG: hypothetical protein ABIQ53_12795, partial [Terracoccus sp.]
SGARGSEQLREITSRGELLSWGSIIRRTARSVVVVVPSREELDLLAHPDRFQLTLLPPSA